MNVALSNTFPKIFSIKASSFAIWFWLLTGLYIYWVFHSYYGHVYALSKLLIDTPLQVIFSLLYLRFVLPLLKERRNYSLFVLYSVIMIISIVLVGHGLLYWYAMKFEPTILDRRDLFSWRELAGAPFDYIPIPFLFIGIQIIRQSYQITLENQKLANARKEAEINLLKAKINPHFLFNTLNNLYGLCLSGSKHTADSIHQLSIIMQYMMYDSDKEFIPLHKELEYIENYIALEQVRYGERLNLSVSINVPASARSQAVAPLLLLPFLENAFKHGASKQDGNVWITLSLSVVGGALRYHVKNSCKSSSGQESSNPNSGLQILRYRLAQIYPDKYFISTELENDTFTAKLEIDL